VTTATLNTTWRTATSVVAAFPRIFTSLCVGIAVPQTQVMLTLHSLQHCVTEHKVGDLVLATEWFDRAATAYQLEAAAATADDGGESDAAARALFCVMHFCRL